MGSPNAALATLLFFEAPRLCSRAANLQRGSRLLRQDHKVMSASRSIVLQNSAGIDFGY
jgi:hypothetical protein